MLGEQSVLIVCAGNSGSSAGAHPAPVRAEEVTAIAAFTEVGDERALAFRRVRDKTQARIMVFLGEGAYGSPEQGWLFLYCSSKSMRLHEEMKTMRVFAISTLLVGAGRSRTYHACMAQSTVWDWRLM